MVFSVKKFLQNKKIVFSLSSQLISILVSVVMTVGVTRYISVENYGYWQLFIFYTSYIGLAHFGICDGLYLFYGGRKKEEIDKNKLKGVFYLFILLQLVIATIITLYATLSNIVEVRKNILYSISLLLLISNTQIFFSYVLLATNNIVEYSKSIFLEKIVLLGIIFGSVFLNIISLKVLIFSFIFSKTLSLIYLSKFFKSFFILKKVIHKNFTFNLIKDGGILMASNIVSTLILGVGRYFIDENWDIEVFGKISLAIALAYFVMILLSQISFLLFPYLRNSTEEKQKDTLQKLNETVSLILKISIICYFPLMFVLKYLLPNYSESVHYLILFMPLCLYDGKMQIIYGSYFKNLFLQKQLLFINIFSFILSLIIAILGSYLFENLNIILLGMVASIVLRSIISEIIITHKYDVKNYYSILIDLLFSVTIIFYFFTNFNIYILLSLLSLSVLCSFNLKSFLLK